MEWPPTASTGDAVVVREDPSPGSRFVVHGSRGPQFACRTYSEAEDRALSYAERAGACAWYADAGRLRLLGSFVRAPVAPPANRPVGATPEPKGGGAASAGYDVESTAFNKRE